MERTIKFSVNTVKWFDRINGNTYHSKENGKNVLSSWSGLTISDKVEILNYSTDNFGGKRTYLRFVFDNEIWSGFSMGVGMYMRAKRTKIKELYA